MCSRTNACYSSITPYLRKSSGISVPSVHCYVTSLQVGVRIHRLALSGGELAELGLRGREIGQTQRRLARHVLAHPEDNRRELLLELLEKPDC